MTTLLDSICKVPGIRVGHAQNDTARTGCTVIIPEHGAVCGVDIRGSSPGTREVELLKPVRHVEKVHAIVLTVVYYFGKELEKGAEAVFTGKVKLHIHIEND